MSCRVISWKDNDAVGDASCSWKDIDVTVVGKIHMKLVTKSKPTAGPFQPRTGLSKSV